MDSSHPKGDLSTKTGQLHSFAAVLELKAPGTDLDAPQARDDHLTAVEQAFEYGEAILGVSWVLVSDMQRIRLYSVESSDAFEEFELARCVDGEQPTEHLRQLVFMLHHDYLVKEDRNSAVSLLLDKSASRQLELREGFYEAYYEIRVDLFEAISEACASVGEAVTRDELLRATQRLLDRLLFIYYCEDHPQQLLPRDTIKGVTAAAQILPGPSTTKVYDYLRNLFREIDVGSPVGSGMQLDGYNGELFKEHPIIDQISLPDALHHRKYTVRDSSGGFRTVHGAWGLHEFDFWKELNEHLLGHVFEESLSDLVSLGSGEPVSLARKLEERRRKGIFYTSDIISDFLAASSIRELLGTPTVSADDPGELGLALEARIEALIGLRVVDLACGSGAFLVSVYQQMLRELWRLRESIAILQAGGASGQLDLGSVQAGISQAVLLRQCLFGVDLLPQAVEIAKLALWLRSAHRGEKVADLGNHLVAADSLVLPDVFDALELEAGSFDLVTGNPPWGGDVEEATYRRCVEYLELDDSEVWDSWELFLFVGLHALREGGRLALVLPDSFLYPAKARTRELVLKRMTVEKVHSLGPDWFGSQIRMGTILLEARKGVSEDPGDLRAMLLSGQSRRMAIRGQIPLRQLEAQRSRAIPLSRCLASPTYDIEVFRDRRDDEILSRILEHSVALSELCERARGEEMSKTGRVWKCPSCLDPTTPGKKKKGGGYDSKECPTCGLRLHERDVNVLDLVTEVREPEREYGSYIDGDDISRRYVQPSSQKHLLIGLSGWKYKAHETYTEPKILIRQAGVGLLATYDTSGSWCPQSVYIYRLRPKLAAEGYRHEFVLGALLSRVMAFFIFKRFAEVDPAKAHAKLTHDRLASIPIPRVDFGKKEQARLYDRVVVLVRALLDGDADLGGTEDRAVEAALRKLWEISADEGAYINGEFADLPRSQVIRDLFPDGVPTWVRRQPR